MSTKTLVIGLDGATFDLIQPMVDRGELPTFARLMTEGAWGTLRSTIPPVSPQAWSSFLTGVHPGRHGIFGFLDAPQGHFYRRPILSAQDIQVPTLLQIAGEAGRRIAAFGIPMTYPPAPINGVMVPEQHGPPLSHPPHLWDELVATVGDPRDQAIHIPYLFTQDKRGYVTRLHELLEVQRRAIQKLLNREAFDLSIVVFTVTDRMSHFLWKHTDVTHPDHQPRWAEVLGDALPDMYRRLDAIIAELWKLMGPDSTLIVMSDHGFGPLHKRVFINRWLWEQGLLAVRPLAYQLASIRYPWPLLRVYNSLARRLGLPYLALPIGRWQKPIDPELYEPRFFFNAHTLIDWHRTQVYSGDDAEQGIYINLRGREPHGTISPGDEYKRLRQKLRQALLSITDPDDGRPVVEHVWFREETYTGPQQKSAPDLVLQFRDFNYALSTDLFVPDVVAPARYRSGTHHPEGICLLAGPHIQSGISLDEATIVDMAPTVLHLLDVPVPKYIEGRVLEEAFTPQWRVAHPVRRVAFGGSATPDNNGDLTEEQVAALEAHLRSLGYIG